MGARAFTNLQVVVDFDKDLDKLPNGVGTDEITRPSAELLALMRAQRHRTNIPHRYDIMGKDVHQRSIKRLHGDAIAQRERQVSA